MREWNWLDGSDPSIPDQYPSYMARVQDEAACQQMLQDIFFVGGASDTGASALCRSEGALGGVPEATYHRSLA